MSRLLSVLIALFALLYAVIAIPIPRDTALELRDFSDEEVAHATRDYVDSLDELDRRKFKLKGAFNKLKGLAKTGLSIAGKFNPALGVASQFLGRDVEDEISLRDVEDELAEELTLRDDDSEELARRKFKLKGAFNKLKGLAKTGLSIAGKFNPAFGVASQFLGRDVEDEISLRDIEDTLTEELALRDLDDDELARRKFKLKGAFNKLKGLAKTGLSIAGKFNPAFGVASQFLGRDVEDDEELLARDDEEEFDLRDLSDEDVALTVRSVWPELSDVERRNFLDSIRNAAARVKSAAGVVGNYAAPARSILGGAAGFASKFGGARGRALSRGLQTANRAVGHVHRASSRIAYRDVEDDE